MIASMEPGPDALWWMTACALAVLCACDPEPAGPRGPQPLERPASASETRPAASRAFLDVIGYQPGTCPTCKRKGGCRKPRKGKPARKRPRDRAGSGP